MGVGNGGVEFNRKELVVGIFGSWGCLGFVLFEMVLIFLLIFCVLILFLIMLRMDLIF